MNKRLTKQQRRQIASARRGVKFIPGTDAEKYLGAMQRQSFHTHPVATLIEEDEYEYSEDTLEYEFGRVN